MTKHRAGIFARGKWIDTDLVEFGGRSTGVTFLSPNPEINLPLLSLQSPGALSDLHELSFEDTLDFVERLGTHLRTSDNPYLQQAFEVSCLTSSLTPPVLRKIYDSLPHMFNRNLAREMAENTIGIEYLEGWVTSEHIDGRRVSIRAFGARALHIIAGNTPVIAALSILRNILTRSDAIIKSPSNDPFTALAIARTMLDMDPNHPVTKHLAVAYWKGGDEAVEKKLYQPARVEKIVAWGGLASVKHVTKYIQPGLELISLDPKRSISIIGGEAFSSEQSRREVALRLATDIGAVNQEGCINARTVYVLSGTDEPGIEKLEKLGKDTYDALVNLSPGVSTPSKDINQELRSQIVATRLNEEWYRVFGGKADEGAIIVSRLAEPVDFATILSNRVANLVPIDDLKEIYPAVDSYTQTVGVYPESLKAAVRDRLSLYGAQRFTSLGYAASPAIATPQDGIETMRQMCKWIVCEDCDPKVTTPLWEDAELFKYKLA